MCLASCGLRRAVAREERAGDGVRGRTSSEHIGLLLGEMAFAERSARAGLEVLLKSQSAFFRFEGNIELEFPRAKFGSVARDVGLMLFDSVPEFGRITNVVVSRSGYRFEDVNVVHGAGPPSSGYRRTTARRFRPLGLSLPNVLSELRAAPRCSPRGTSGRKRVKGIEPSCCDAPRQRIGPTRGKDGCIRQKTKAYMCENMCDFSSFSWERAN